MQAGVGRTVSFKTLGIRLRTDRQSRRRLRARLRDERRHMGQRDVPRQGSSRRHRRGGQQETFLETCDIISLHMRLVDAKLVGSSPPPT